MNSKTFYKCENNCLTVGNSLFTKSFENRKNAHAAMDDENHLSEPFLKITADGDNGQHTYCIWEDLPVVYMPDYSEKVLLTIKGEHWLIKTIRLSAFTDEYDTLTHEEENHLSHHR